MEQRPKQDLHRYLLPAGGGRGFGIRVRRCSRDIPKEFEETVDHRTTRTATPCGSQHRTGSTVAVVPARLAASIPLRRWSAGWLWTLAGCLRRNKDVSARRSRWKTLAPVCWLTS